MIQEYVQEFSIDERVYVRDLDVYGTVKARGLTDTGTEYTVLCAHPLPNFEWRGFGNRLRPANK